MSIQQAAIRAIEAQQEKVEYHSNQWAVGEQLKGICLREPKSAELILRDLQVKEMSIVEAEKKIKAFADKRRKGNSSNVSLFDAEDILREFYGLSKPEELAPASPPAPASVQAPAVTDWGLIDPLDFL